MIGRLRERREDLVRVHRGRVADQRLRVLFVTSMWPDEERPDYGIFIKTQARSLEACGIHVDVIAIRGYKSTLAYLLARPVVKHAVETNGYDLLHVHTGHAAAVSLVGIRCPSVLSFVGGDVLGNPGERGTPISSRLLAAFMRQFARSSDATITKSREMELALPMSVRSRNHVIPNGVDLGAFGRVQREQARRMLGWEADGPVILFLGNPEDPRKNAALARAAVAELQKSGPAVRLHVGWGTNPSEIPLLMAGADALVFPSRSEGSPNVVKEAMASRLPIVATPVGDVPERLEGIAECFVVEPDPVAFAKALSRALEQGRAPAAREAVRALTLEAVASQIAALYARVIGGTPDALAEAAESRSEAALGSPTRADRAGAI